LFFLSVFEKDLNQFALSTKIHPPAL